MDACVGFVCSNIRKDHPASVRMCGGGGWKVAAAKRTLTGLRLFCETNARVHLYAY